MSIYSQNIIEHYKFPQNKKRMNNCDYKGENINRSCGDSITIYLKLEKDKDTIKSITFEGDGCSVSMATASILSEELVGMKKDDILGLKLKNIEEFLGISIGANRIKCALMALNIIQDGLKKI